MITFDQAFDIVMASARRLGTEKVPLAGALGRILAADAVSDTDMPPADVSIMDGFACRRKDLDADAPVLTEIETIPAGYLPTRPVGPNQCARIMTGAVIPQGADAVVMVEDARQDDNRIRVIKKPDRAYIRPRGQDVKKGDVVLRAGVQIGPPEIAVLASVGLDPVSVAVAPRVGVLTTGDELVEPAETPGPGHIRSSNGPQLCAQIARAGARPRYFGIAPDRPEAIARALAQVMAESDVVLLSGGVSVGQFDFVPDVLRQSGVDLKFRRVCVKPGRPTVFGLSANRYFFGLPGNPAATFVIFEILVRPFLLALMGHRYEPVRVRGHLTTQFQRKDADRREFVPVVLAPDGGVSTLDYHGSAHIHALCGANGLLDIPASCQAIPGGAEVIIHLI